MYHDYKSAFSNKLAETQFKNYEIIERKEEVDHFNEQYYFLLRIKPKSTSQMVSEQVYYRFQKGDYLYIEKHRGLLGIDWTTYR